jgi:A/G-specific adenine glycosylase
MWISPAVEGARGWTVRVHMVDVGRNDLRSASGEADLRAVSVTEDLRAAILGWYDEHGRSLLFRSTKDPYAVLVSEVMAQQTQVSRVDGAWTAFLAAFPTIAALADATPADVVRAWRGLGYNRRSLNLWRAARVVVEEHGGELPRDVAALERLPGVGPYTARAVAAIAFGVPVGAVDTNVRRVLARTLRGSRDSFTAAEIQRTADASVPRDRSADWTHALMDVGSTFCRSRAPTCSPCPARRHCRYAAADGAEEQPRAVAVRPEQFPATSRWLRGRILDRLRDGGGWVVLDAAIGQHDRAAIEAALRSMAAEGLLQRDADRPLRARLPIANAAAAG